MSVDGLRDRHGRTVRPSPEDVSRGTITVRSALVSSQAAKRGAGAVTYPRRGQPPLCAVRNEPLPMRRQIRSSAKALGYEGTRPDVQQLVPVSARRILDIGCSSGALGAALRERQNAYVVGIELDPDYAAEARARLDQVAVGSAQDILTDDSQRAPLGVFDCIIAADVLEHLVDPWATLRAAVKSLAPGGAVIVSLPNARFWLTFWYLGVRGTWPRREVGVHDATHLRWFTRRDACALLHQANLTVESISANYKVNYYAKPVDRALAPLLRHLPLREFFAAQHLLVGTVGASHSLAPPPSVSPIRGS